MFLENLRKLLETFKINLVKFKKNLENFINFFNILWKYQTFRINKKCYCVYWKNFNMKKFRKFYLQFWKCFKINLEFLEVLIEIFKIN